jgi:DNA polymerase zeta
VLTCALNLIRKLFINLNLEFYLFREWISRDRRAEPRVGERVGYVVVCGPPGLPLIQLIRPPREVLHDVSFKINSEYYITKAILPPLDRCFSLVGANVFNW